MISAARAALSALAALALVGCTAQSAPTSPAEVSEPPALAIGIAFAPGGRGDGGLNDSVAGGVTKATSDFRLDAVEKTATAKESTSARSTLLAGLVAGGATGVVAVGSDYVGAVPSQSAAKFLIVDDAQGKASGDNVASIRFAVNEGSYLMGAAAALKSTAKHIGFVGAADDAVTRSYYAGYAAGASSVSAKVKIEVGYLGGGAAVTVAAARTAAAKQYAAGAQVVYAVAGSASTGVFEAAVAAKGKAIGSDVDESRIVSAKLQPVILTSMVKRAEGAVYSYLTDLQAGKFTAGVRTYGVKQDGLVYSTTSGQIDDITGKLDLISQQIGDGTITVPTS